jgi:fatty acid desaturase
MYVLQISGKHSHNVRHHTWTNVIGKDADVAGYGLLRIFPEQKWKKFNLGNPIYAVLLALFFEWGIAIQELELGLIFTGKRKLSKIRPMLNKTGTKMLRQVLKDYVLFPLLAGPFFFYVAGANAIACIMRNLWTYIIIFCGHFAEGVHVFSRKQVENETRSHWYVRQLLGSCNIKGGKLFHIMSGNLSHQMSTICFLICQAIDIPRLLRELEHSVLDTIFRITLVPYRGNLELQY